MKKSMFFALSGLLVVPLAFADLPAATTTGAATYLSGGIGQDEATAIQHEASKYPVELEFVVKAQPRDEFTADVHVKVTDNHGKQILDTVSNGPFLLAQLPNGHYRVDAMKNGQTKTRDMTVKAGAHQHLIFEWNPVTPVATP